MIIVLDTNVLVSGLINPHGPPGRIVDLLRSGFLQLAVDDRIMSEYVDVLNRDYLAPYFANRDIEHIVEYLRGNSEYVLADKISFDLSDPDDLPFAEVAFHAKVILVTGKAKHFPKSKLRGLVVKSPVDFLSNLKT